MKKKFFNRALCAMLSALCVFGALLFALCFPAEAQTPAKVYRVGFLGISKGLRVKDLRQGLRDLGYIEGKNIVIETRRALGNRDRLPQLAAELVRLKVDVLVAARTVGGLAAKSATNVIPIVVIGSGDPVGSGLVASLARPGGNVTGSSVFSEGLNGKRLELLKEAFPKISRVAVFWNPADRLHRGYVKELEAAAQALGVKLQLLEVQHPSDIEKAFSAITKQGADAVLPMQQAPIGGFSTHRRRIFDPIVKNRLPAMYFETRWVRTGGLMSYGPTSAGLWRRAAYFVDRILKGAKPADLPVEQPTRFELVINLKTAKKQGLTFSPQFLARADKVIK